MRLRFKLSFCLLGIVVLVQASGQGLSLGCGDEMEVLETSFE